jgi:hypothetical protein
MSARTGVKRHGWVVALALVLIWALLCFLIVLSPRMRHMNQVSQQLTGRSNELREMQREIENARIAGGPAVGEARFDKFGILARNEEPLFLRDLIDFCKETNNILNLVRRSQYARRAAATQDEVAQQETGQPSTTAKGKKPGEAPRPVVDRVPHSVSFSGTFLSAFYLLRKLESYRRLLTVERVDLTVDNREGYPRLNGNITIDLYLARVPSVAGAGQQAQAGASAGSEATATRGAAPAGPTAAPPGRPGRSGG